MNFIFWNTELHGGGTELHRAKTLCEAPFISVKLFLLFTHE